jgi:hypothetical protein
MQRTGRDGSNGKMNRGKEGTVLECERVLTNGRSFILDGSNAHGGKKQSE